MHSDALEICTRPYRVRLLPHARETLESYARRLLAANYDDPAHRRHLVALAAKANPDIPKRELYEHIIERKGDLNEGHFARAAQTGLCHRDGSTCKHCTAGLAGRYMCVECTHGAIVEEYPHLDQNVCPKHNRWLGPGVTPAEQAVVGSAHIAAEMQFLRLRRRGLMGAQYYMEMRAIFRTWYRTVHGDVLDTSRADRETYPAMMRLAAAIADRTFRDEFFDPNSTFAASYKLLTDTIREAIGEAAAVLSRPIWLYLRPVFLSIREFLVTERVTFSPGWEHDFPIPPRVVEQFRRPTRPFEPFRRYLDASGDYTLTESNWREVLVHIPSGTTVRGDESPRSHVLGAICHEGHRVTRHAGRPAALNSKFGGCGVCSHQTLVVGYNDLATTHPQVGREMHPTRNGSRNATNTFAGYPNNVWWICPVCKQDYESTVDHRTRMGTGCPVCKSRKVVPDINSLLLRRPDLSAEWGPGNDRGPEAVTVGSGYVALWRCPVAGHLYPMRVLTRSRGAGCRECRATNRQAQHQMQCRRRRTPSTPSALAQTDATPGSQHSQPGRGRQLQPVTPGAPPTETLTGRIPTSDQGISPSQDRSPNPRVPCSNQDRYRPQESHTDNCTSTLT